MTQQILRLKEVVSKVGLSRTTIYRLISKKAFPKQIKLGERSSGWLSAEIDAWLLERVNTSRAENISSN